MSTVERPRSFRKHRAGRCMVVGLLLVILLTPFATIYYLWIGAENHDAAQPVVLQQQRRDTLARPSARASTSQPLSSLQPKFLRLPSTELTMPTTTPSTPVTDYPVVFNETNETVLAYFDALDPLPPRAGELPIRFMEYIDCLEQRLRVDRQSKMEIPIQDTEAFFPYLVLPITFELRDLKQFLCNVTVPVKHLMIVQNGPLRSTSEFLDATEAIFAFTPRLVVRRFPRNRGYAGALNVGMRHAMSFPIEEVPFYFMSNTDVRFRESTLVQGLPRFQAASLKGADLLQQLQAEVATEPNEYTPPQFRDVPLRSWDGEHVLTTSRSLPDRVRYMAVADRRTIFRDHVGLLYPNMDPQTAAWGFSRLMIETVGFFDENCFPAYYEDSEYISRSQLFGFKVMRGVLSTVGMVHLVNNFLSTTKSHSKAGSLGDTLVFLRGMTEVIVHMLPHQYVARKGMYVNLGTQRSRMRANNMLLPPDAFVLLERRRRVLEEMIELSMEYYRGPNPETDRYYPNKLIDFVEPAKRRQLLTELHKHMNVLEVYKNGSSLRRITVPM
uniref:Putative galactofuranosyltransferase n=1 Tax=Angomonas deanei TaxID=59799 RepID=C6K3N2_9TRYP|nr:putative galactofuranosyltransferase [Angomonas deanei]